MIEDPRHVYRGRRVLVTGHTGFKGSWLSLWLSELGARVTGLALPPPTSPSHFELARVGPLIQHREGDIRDRDLVASVLREARPEIVFHLAAQSRVRESYRDPLTTLTTNFLGTANLLDAVRAADGEPPAIVVVTSDKCYENREWPFGYRENDALGGHDPYSMSKAATELLVSSFRRSFFPESPLATARAGNVIGGGDFTPDRIVPDCVRAWSRGEALRVRNPDAIRPWQHVLEPLSGYLTLGSRLLLEPKEGRRTLSDAWNFGPAEDTARTVRDVIDGLAAFWKPDRACDWETLPADRALHEAGLLRLSIDKARFGLSWSPRWSFEETLGRTAAWYTAFFANQDLRKASIVQIEEYQAG